MLKRLIVLENIRAMRAICFMIVVIGFISCERNVNPVCHITNPSENESFYQGEIIPITVDATDSDGFISDVRIYSNNVGIISISEFPYNYDFDTEGYDPGTYTIRAVAKDNDGEEAEDKVMVVINEPSTLTDYDGNVYQLVRIGAQVWMAENLKVTHFTDGTPIPEVTSHEEWDALEMTGRAYCWFGNDPILGDSYGALYTWGAAMNGQAGNDLNPSGIQGVCPDGWHLPSDSEWKVLELFLGMSPEEVEKYDAFRGTDEGGKLKEAGLEYWESPNTGANNESGFTVLPAGQRLRDGEWYRIGSGAYLWSATESDVGWSAVTRHLDHIHAEINSHPNELDHGNSVRCVKN